MIAQSAGCRGDVAGSLRNAGSMASCRVICTGGVPLFWRDASVMASVKSSRRVTTRGGGTGHPNLPGLPVNSDNRAQAFAGQLPIGGVVNLEP